MSSNLYKHHSIINKGNGTRVINSNQLLAARLEEILKASAPEDGFMQGIAAQEVEVEPEISLEEIHKQADEILAAANEKAKQIVDEAQSQAASVLESSRLEGEQKGYEAGVIKAQEEAEAAKQEWNMRRQELEKEFEREREELEPKIVKEVCNLMEKIFQVSFQDTESIILHLLKNAILKIDSTKEFLVRVNDKVYPYIEEKKEEILTQVGQSIKLEVEADASLTREQCVIETEAGYFDCSIDVQFKNLIKAICLLSV